jgi:hypothetical protein
MPSSSETPRLARVPDFRRVNGADIARHKSLARNAYLAARRAQPIPTAIIDKLWVDTLSATEAVPPNVGATLFRRHEVLCKLLLDRLCWRRP